MAGLDLGKQLGPLPLGAWIVVVGGGLGIAWYSRNSGGGTVDVPVEDTSGVPGVGNGPGWVAVPPPSGNPDSGVKPVTTNEEWARQAITRLIALGNDASVVDTAIRKYLESTELNIQERAIVTQALTLLGAPPVPLPIPPPLPSIPQPQPQPQPQQPTPQPQPQPQPVRPAIRI